MSSETVVGNIDDIRVFKMLRILLLLLVLAIFSATYDCASIPDVTDLSSSGRTGGLRDWMRNMRSRLSNKEPGGRMMGLMNNMSQMKLPSAVVSMITGDRMFRSIDLANVKFDPSTDRGYRMGNWFVIRRRNSNNNNNNKDEETDDWSEFFDKKVVDSTTGCVIVQEPIKTTMKKESMEDDDLSMEVLSPAPTL